jgi:hypothetical protein
LKCLGSISPRLPWKRRADLQSKPGGWVIVETYLIDQQTIGQPKNLDYLLLHNELLNSFRDFRVFYYREGKFLQSGEGAFRAGLLAAKGS